MARSIGVVSSANYEGLHHNNKEVSENLINDNHTLNVAFLQLLDKMTFWLLKETNKKKDSLYENSIVYGSIVKTKVTLNS